MAADAGAGVGVEDRFRPWEIMARVLFAAAAGVLALAVIGAIGIASSKARIGLGEAEDQGRSAFALLTMAGGAAAAAVIAGLGAVLRMLVEVARGLDARD